MTHVKNEAEAALSIIRARKPQFTHEIVFRCNPKKEAVDRFVRAIKQADRSLLIIEDFVQKSFSRIDGRVVTTLRFGAIYPPEGVPYVTNVLARYFGIHEVKIRKLKTEFSRIAREQTYIEKDASRIVRENYTLILQRIESLHTKAEVAEELGISPNVFGKMLKNVYPALHKFWAEKARLILSKANGGTIFKLLQHRDEVNAMLQAGEKIPTIAHSLHLNLSSVYNAIKKNPDLFPRVTRRAEKE